MEIPSNVGALTALGNMMERRGELERALEFFQRAKEAAPSKGVFTYPSFTNSPPAVIDFGPNYSHYLSSRETAWLQFCLAKYTEARETFTKMYEANPTSSQEEAEALDAIDEVVHGRQSVDRQQKVVLNLKALMAISPANETDPNDVARYANAVLNCLPKGIHDARDARVYVLLLAKASRRHPDVLRQIIHAQPRVTQRDIVTFTLDWLVPQQRKTNVRAGSRGITADSAQPGEASQSRELTAEQRKESALVLTDAGYFFACLLAAKALEVAEEDGIHSHEVDWEPSVAWPITNYPLTARAVIFYETKTNIVTYYRLVKEVAGSDWSISNGWMAADGKTNQIYNLPSKSEQQRANEIARMVTAPLPIMTPQR